MDVFPGPFFQWVLISSVKGGILVVLILLIKALVRNRLGATWHHAVWALLFVQLVLPWTPSSPLSIYNLFPTALVETVLHSGQQPATLSEVMGPVSSSQSPASVSTPETGPPTDNGSLTAVSNPQPGSPAPSVNPFWRAAAWFWLAGAAIFALWIGTAESLFRRKMKKSRPVRDLRLLAILDECQQLAGVRKPLLLMESDNLKSPALFGVFQTRLLLPSGLAGNLTSEQLAHIFLHELVHCQRYDVAVNWIAAALRVMHWFNPLIWYGFYRWQEDQEMSRDALALRYLKPEVVSEYGRTLIRVLEFAGPQPPQFISAAGISGSQSLSKRRIKMLTLFKKPSIKWSLLGAAVIIAVAVAAMTLPKTNAPAAKPDTPGKTQDNPASSAPKDTGSQAADKGAQNTTGQPGQESGVYNNTTYGFTFALPASWSGYSVINGKWEGLPIGGGQAVETGPLISIRHPLWTPQEPRQDIPIMVFTLSQWDSLQQEKFHIGAAPIGPSELGRNNGYVFALPARYNYAFPTGYEEVEQILNEKPLHAVNIAAPKQAAETGAVPADYFPMHQGNQWEYQGSGNEYASFSREVLYVEGGLAQTLEINGGADVTKVYQMTGTTLTEVFTEAESAKPVNRLHEKANGQSILMQAPLSAGTQWRDSHAQWEIVDTKATVETPAGTFENCLKIKSVSFSGDGSAMYQYYAKGVGLVEQDFVAAGGETIASSLKSYHLVP